MLFVTPNTSTAMTSIETAMPNGFPKPTSHPINGFGGSYYTERFRGVPVYNNGKPGVNNEISWKTIDDYSLAIVNITATDSICLGLCLATLVYVISLTPKEKRLKPFQISLLIALVFEVYRLFTVVAPASTPGISSFSSYLLITNDISASTFSTGYYAATISGYFAGCLAYTFTVICLYLQAKGLLAGFELRYPIYHTILLCYLLGVSAITLVANIIFDAFQTARMFGKAQYFPAFNALHKLVLALYAASLGSWCLLSLIVAAVLIFTRFEIVKGNTHYDTVLKIILLTLLDSLIVPFIFCIMQAIPNKIGYLTQAEKIVLPSILVLLPLGSLFMTIQSNYSGTYSSKAPLRDRAAYSTLGSDTARDNSDQTFMETLPTGHGTVSEAYPLRPLPSTIGQHDRALAEIDHMPAELPLVPGEAPMDDITKQRAGLIMRNLAAKNITPVSSRDNIREV